VEATEAGAELRRLEPKIARQQDWLDANRGHPLWIARCDQARIALKQFEYWQHALHGLASQANKLTEQMDADTKERARREIHEWATIGSPGVYAVAFDLVPDKAWLEEETT
jgi:hypothetical protein